MSSPMPSKNKPAPAPEAPARQFRVLLVDDHPIIRQGLAALVATDPELMVCGEADNGPRALELVTKLAPDLAVIDVSLRSGNGLELMKNLRILAPKLPVLFMSMHDETLYAERALRAGAQGYIMKEETNEKILGAIQRVLKGELYLSEKMQERMLRRMARAKPEEPGCAVDTLSDRELEVFQLIGNGFSTRQIAARLNLSVKTIESYREHLKLKLALETGSDLVRHAIQWMKSLDGG